MKFIQKTLLILTATLVLFSCSQYEKVLKGDDYDKKYEMAVDLYNKQKFVKAVPLFEEAISIFSKLSVKGEMGYYYLCYCHYNMQNYGLASYYFKNFAATYPMSVHAEECLFMSAYCKVDASPKSSLDQSFTLEAINELQAFMNRFPKTEKKDTCNQIIDELRDKLEKKAFESANLYYHMEEYEAATVAYNNMLSDYPDTELREEVLYKIVLSNFNLALNSVQEKKLTRFEETMKSYTKFVDNFPNSSFLKELQSIYRKSQMEINLLK